MKKFYEMAATSPDPIPGGYTLQYVFHETDQGRLAAAALVDMTTAQGLYPHYAAPHSVEINNCPLTLANEIIQIMQYPDGDGRKRPLDCFQIRKTPAASFYTPERMAEISSDYARALNPQPPRNGPSRS